MVDEEEQDVVRSVAWTKVDELAVVSVDEVVVVGNGCGW